MLYPAYIRALYLQNIRAFKGEFKIDLSNSRNKPAQWSVILGNNNTGKTTILRAIADLEPKILESFRSSAGQRRIVPAHTIKSVEGSTYAVIPQRRNNDEANNLSAVRCDFFYRLPNLSYNNAVIAYDQLRLKQGMYTDDNDLNWSFNQDKGDVIRADDNLYLESLEFFGYGPSRRISSVALQSDQKSDDTTIGLFKDIELINVEEWLLQTDYAQKNGNTAAGQRLSQIKNVLFASGILADIDGFRFKTDNQLKSYVEVAANNKWIKLSDLSYGYQSLIAWLVDLAKKMFDRYTDLDNPLHGPAIVLVDEIDLHLHPEWQRKIIKYLSDLFPNTQFIVTAHSPLIVQSAENVNLIMLEKDDETGSINVRQQFGSFQGWTVEEILRELMDMGEKTRSDRYLELMRQFEDGLLGEDYAAVKNAYDELDKILSPSSHQRKVLQIQMSSLIPA